MVLVPCQPPIIVVVNLWFIIHYSTLSQEVSDDMKCGFVFIQMYQMKMAWVWSRLKYLCAYYSAFMQEWPKWLKHINIVRCKRASFKLCASIVKSIMYVIYYSPIDQRFWMRYHGNGALHKHLLIMRIFEKILYLHDLFYQIRSSYSESKNSIVTYNVKGNFSQQFFILQYSCFAVCRFSLVNYARFWAD